MSGKRHTNHGQFRLLRVRRYTQTIRAKLSRIYFASFTSHHAANADQIRVQRPCFQPASINYTHEAQRWHRQLANYPQHTAAAVGSKTGKGKLGSRREHVRPVKTASTCRLHAILMPHGLALRPSGRQMQLVPPSFSV